MPSPESGSFGDFDMRTSAPEMDSTKRDIIHQAIMIEGMNDRQLYEIFSPEDVELATRNNISVLEQLDKNNMRARDAEA